MFWQFSAMVNNYISTLKRVLIRPEMFRISRRAKAAFVAVVIWATVEGNTVNWRHNYFIHRMRRMVHIWRPIKRRLKRWFRIYESKGLRAVRNLADGNGLGINPQTAKLALSKRWWSGSETAKCERTKTCTFTLMERERGRDDEHTF